MLPDSFRWADSEDGAILYQNYRCMAIIERGQVVIKRPGGKNLTGRCGSTAQGKRHVERWLAAQLGFGKRFARKPSGRR